MNPHPLRYLEAAVAALALVWLATGLVTHPAAFGAVALLVLLPLAFVVLPALGVHAFGDRSVTVRWLPGPGTVDESTPPRPDRWFPTDD